MGDSVQVWEGDGVMPPEIAAMARRIESLEEQVREMERESSDLVKELQRTTRERDKLSTKLWQIESILKAGPYEDGNEPIADPNDTLFTNNGGSGSNPWSGMVGYKDPDPVYDANTLSFREKPNNG